VPGLPDSGVAGRNRRTKQPLLPQLSEVSWDGSGFSQPGLSAPAGKERNPHG